MAIFDRNRIRNRRQMRLDSRVPAGTTKLIAALLRRRAIGTPKKMATAAAEEFKGGLICLKVALSFS
jgi:hypothetical protein